MTNPVNLRQLLLGGLLLVPALECAALSLDRAKGAAWLGRPLDVTVQVLMDPGDNPGSLCSSADIFHGDTRVRSSQIRVTTEPGPGNDEAILHIRSTALVDEPVVTVYLKVGCNQGMTRRYVLLAELPPEALMAPPQASRFRGLIEAQPRATKASADASPLLRDSATDNMQRSPPESVTKRAESNAKTKRPASDAASVTVISPQRASNVMRRKKTEDEVRGRGRPRLELDPPEFLAERDPVLRSSMELLSVPDESPTRRAEAGALWRAIQTTPEDILKTQQQLQALKTDVDTLRSQSRKSESLATDLQARLKQAQAQQYGNTLVYSLWAVLLLALATAAYFWNQHRGSAKRYWWSADANVEEEKTAGRAISVPVVNEVPQASTMESFHNAEEIRPPHGALPSVPKAAPRVPLPSSVPAPVQASAPAHALDRLDFDINAPGRAVKVEELFDVQQQADFFISLGEYDKAIATLTDHIAENPETSALAYLDLLEIYHLQGREQEYNAVSQEFSSAFNAEVPAFDDFGLQSRGLESYETAMSRIAALWPASKVLDVIEESVFRKPGGGHPAFDLDAYRELLLLYAVAMEIVETRDSGRAPENTGEDSVPRAENMEKTRASNGNPPFQTTYIEPLAANPREDDALSPALEVTTPCKLDVDLTDLATEPPQTTESSPTEPRKSPESTLAAGENTPLIDFDVFDLPPYKRDTSRHDKG